MASFLIESLIFRHPSGQVLAGPKADWNRGAMNNKVLTPVRLLNWAVVYPSRLEADVRKFIETLGGCAQKTGIEISRPTVSCPGLNHIIRFNFFRIEVAE